MAGRYEGRPLLRLVELYILWAIGELAEEDELRLLDMTPKLQSLYGVDGAWHEVIEQILELRSETASSLREIWRRNLEIGPGLTPQQFAETVADENFGAPLGA